MHRGGGEKKEEKREDRLIPRESATKKGELSLLTKRGSLAPAPHIRGRMRKGREKDLGAEGSKKKEPGVLRFSIREAGGRNRERRGKRKKSSPIPRPPGAEGGGPFSPKVGGGRGGRGGRSKQKSQEERTPVFRLTPRKGGATFSLGVPGGRGACLLGLTPKSHSTEKGGREINNTNGGGEKRRKEGEKRSINRSDGTGKGEKKTRNTSFISHAGERGKRLTASARGERRHPDLKERLLLLRKKRTHPPRTKEKKGGRR